MVFKCFLCLSWVGLLTEEKVKGLWDFFQGLGCKNLFLDAEGSFRVCAGECKWGGGKDECRVRVASGWRAWGGEVTGGMTRAYLGKEGEEVDIIGRSHRQQSGGG